MADLFKITEEPLKNLIHILLKDQTTGKNIIFATDAYKGILPTDQIEVSMFSGDSPLSIQPRSYKTQDEQQQRTRHMAEVFTPVWLCNQMNNYLDEECFGRKDVFNTISPDNTWTPTEGEITFPSDKTWKDYILSKRIEITCGEAPYLVSRYDTVDGKTVLPLNKRIGLLDRKLRVITENAQTEEEWIEWAKKAIQSCYGYEYQGDSLLIARINIVLSFYEYYLDHWNTIPPKKDLQEISEIVSWNLWQMDGITDAPPLGETEESEQLDLFAFEETKETVPFSLIKDWENNKTLMYKSIKEGTLMKKKLFDFAIGNPPYQDEKKDSGNKTYAPPIYNVFMEGSFEVAEKVELIHPARFLFDAGSTPKAWNHKMLHDPHFKVLRYIPNGKKVFSNTEIKGGVAITYRDSNSYFGEIKHFIADDILRSIFNKVQQTEPESLSDIIYAAESYRFTDKMHEDYPEVEAMLSAGHKYDLKTTVLKKLDGIIFFENKPDSQHKYAQIYGLEGTKRCCKWIRCDYIKPCLNFESYKVLIPAANGSGKFGEVLSSPLIGAPLIGHTQTFLSIGTFSKEEAEGALKYIKSKFTRAMLGILKVTQHNPGPKWKYVPLQDFTSSSDIDWSGSVHDIDLQLYKKYGLSEEEIAFIESHVKEMK